MKEMITLAHGSGGKLTHQLISQVFTRHFSNEILLSGDDAAKLKLGMGDIAFTTDSFVISPVFFKGGDIGKLSVCGTVNDLVSSGAKPLYLSCGFIIEEGFSIEELEKIVISMGETAKSCGVKIVTGDTKVVQRGAADKIFINTSGIGIIHEGLSVSGSNAKSKDKVIVTGTIGDHGCSILVEREGLHISADIESDCTPLNGLIESVLDVTRDIHVLRDPTRGGVATTLNEICVQSNVGIKLFETSIPVREEVRGVCELLGMDPLYMANEGKMLIIVPEDKAELVLNNLRKHDKGRESSIIGEVMDTPKNKVIMETVSGGSRIVDMLVGDQLPRIC